MGRLAEECAGLGVEDPLVRRAAVGADERPLGRPAVGDGQVVQGLVAGLAGGVEDDRHVHHDVDEQALGRDERAEVSPLGVEPQRQGPPGRDQDLVERARRRSARYQGR